MSDPYDDEPEIPEPLDDPDDELDDDECEESEDVDTECNVSERDLALIDDEDIDFEFFDDVNEPDTEELNAMKRLRKKILKRLEKPNTRKSYVKERNSLVRKIKKLVEEIDVLLLTEAYNRRETLTGFYNKHEELRKGLLKALISTMDIDTKIAMVKDLLNELSDDEEFVEYYIA